MLSLYAAAAAKSFQSCPTLCDPIEGSPPGSSIHVIFQARVLEWREPLQIHLIVAELVKNTLAMQETPVRFLSWEDPLEKGKATHCSTRLENSMDCMVHWVTKSQT